jgi:tyrosyl-tRNA synthetase
MTESHISIDNLDNLDNLDNSANSADTANSTNTDTGNLDNLDKLLLNESEQVINMVRDLASVGEEITMNYELVNLVRSVVEGKKTQVVCYDGFEPSGRMHIAQGLVRAFNVNKFTKYGFKFKFWVADWFAQLNMKFGGNLTKIKKAGDLMIHMWKACGMDMSHVEFIWASDSIRAESEVYYWQRVMDIMRTFSIQRFIKCGQIMGREESLNLQGSQLMYPAMQCADIFHLKADICSLGMDQRKVNMLAREYSSRMGHKFHPIIISHHMLLGLDGTKMSKSDPENAIFMDDTAPDIKRKITKAFCEPSNIEKNPILEYFKYIVFKIKTDVDINVFNVDTRQHNKKTFTDYNTFESDYAQQMLHPADIKPALVNYINEFLEPVRRYISENKDVTKLIKEVKNMK